MAAGWPPPAALVADAAERRGRPCRPVRREARTWPWRAVAIYGDKLQAGLNLVITAKVAGAGGVITSWFPPSVPAICESYLPEPVTP